MSSAAISDAGLPDAGISETLARERAAQIRDLRYDLAFSIPGDRATPIDGRVSLRFTLDCSHRVVLDFARPGQHVRSLRVAGTDTEFATHENHLIIAAEKLTSGENEIVIDFVAGNAPLNRHDDFLYTLFVPARAHWAFPCFDQPDLKARYALTLDLPLEWQSVANADVAETQEHEGRRRVRFAQTSPLPTYLFGFVVGTFAMETASRRGREFRMFHREADAAKLRSNRDAICDLHATALEWLENYTGIPYPFGKFDFALIPSFQFGGMEHPGAILYNPSYLMLDESATQNQLLHRASLIAHETSHLWFGDLVTMKWFDDVWTKEVFANFMAAKIVNPSFPDIDHDLRFFLAHYPDAYDIDRTHGANPIRQPLGNLNEAGQLYGPIIYKKAPIVMRQLEMIVGEEALRNGLQKYLTKYSYRNATWGDLVAILNAETPHDLQAWSRSWIDERGRPDFTSALEPDANDRVSSLTLEASDPLERGVVWPQRLLVTMGYATTSTNIPVSVSGRSTSVPEATGMPQPLYVLPNGSGLGYGLFMLDDASRRYLLTHLPEIPDALTRGTAWVTLWDNVIESRIEPDTFIDVALRVLATESDEQNTQRILDDLTRAYWRFLTHKSRLRLAVAVETALRTRIARSDTPSVKAACFAAFRGMVLTSEGLDWLENVWRRQEKIERLMFAEADEIGMAVELAMRQVRGWPAILEQQLERTEDADRRARLAFVMPALSSDDSVRERAFDRFRSVENRQPEAWVLESQRYLHHPLRQSHATRFIRPSLDLLGEIQRTGDIFFPLRWLEATLAGHYSQEAATIVEGFLTENPQYPVRLRWAILSAADHLLRLLETLTEGGSFWTQFA